MDPITTIILGALGNGLYDVVIKGVKRLSRPSKLDKLLGDLRWKRLYEQAGLIDRVERYREEGSQDALMEVGQVMQEALQRKEFASLASDVQAILTSQEGLRDMMGAGFSQLIVGQDEIKDMIRQIPQGSVAIQINQYNTVQINRDVFVPVLTVGVLKEYLRMVAEQHEYLDMIDLRRRIRLEDIYVTLKMARKVRRREIPGEEDRYGKQVEHRVWRDRGERSIVEQLEEVKLENALREKRLVFRGDPGVGKTTLLRHLAYTYSTEDAGKRPIPIFVTLADLSDRFNADLDLWLQHYYPKQADLLKDKLQNGECTVLLDGLDEVKKDNWDGVRSEAVKLVDWKNQVILSCRGVAYPEGFMPAQFKIYEVVGFSEKQQHQFLDKWFEEEPGKAGKLFKALKSNPRMREFTQNPLLLSLTAVICENDPEFQLPMQRVELYERAMELLMRRWNEKRSPGKKAKFDVIDKREFLEETAFDYFIKGEEIFEERDLLNQIREWQRERGTLTEGTREELLEELTAHNGFLVRYADSRYRFLHLTFQECFTACALHRHGDWERFVERYVWHPRWEEVIRLLGSLMDDASPLISLIWHPDVEDDIFGSRLLLACRCLGDVQAAGDLWKEIAKRVYRVYRQAEFTSDDLRTDTIEAYSLLTQRYPGVLDRFYADLKDGSTDARRRAAQELGEIGNEDAVEPLICALKDEDKDSLIRNSVASALGHIGSEHALKPLMDMLKDKEGNSFVRRIVAGALGQIGSEDAVKVLVDALGDEDSEVRGRAAYALGNIGSEDAIPPLIDMLKVEDEVSILQRHTSAAAAALGRIGSEDAVQSLIDALKADNHRISDSAAEALGNIGSKDAVKALIDVLKDKKAFSRGSAARALGNVGNEDALRSLINVLKDKDEDEYSLHRIDVAEALGNMGGEDAVKALMDRLKDKNEEAVIRMNAAIALGNIGIEDAVKTLIDGLNWYHSTSMIAAEALGRIGSEDAVEPLMERLKDEDEVADVRWSAAMALGSIGGEDAVKILMDALEDDDDFVRGTAVDALYVFSHPPERVIFHDGVRDFS